MHCSNDRRRIALILDYDGTGYKGFQWQAHAPTIQGELERAIKSLTHESTRVRGASRTDAGAHARGQVVDFLTHAPYTTETFVDALNWHLPPDIKVRGAYQVSPDFSSRKDAVGRTYLYTLLNARWPSALLRDFSHWVSSPLDIGRMKEAASYLPGTHDFSALTSSLPPGRSAVREVARWDVWRDGELVYIEACATGFLLHQIRRTNGILVDIGLGRLPVEIMREIMDGTLKELKYCPSLPARGLCLMSVHYLNFPPEVGGNYEAG